MELVSNRMDSFTREAVATALKNMFAGSHFSICTLDTCIKLAKVIVPSQQYEALRAIHCVHWSEMDPDFRKQVFNRVMAIFADDNGFDLSAIDRGFNLVHAQDIGRVVSIQDGGGNKRRALGLPWRRS